MSDAATTLVWFRRDLRLADHPGVRAAADGGRAAFLFVLDPGILARRHHEAPPRLRFLRAGLEALDAELRERGSRLIVRTGPPEQVVPEVAGEAGASVVTWSRELSPLGRARDERVRAALEEARVEVRETAGDMVAEPSDLTGSSGEGYLVFTPFHRVWRDLPLPDHVPAPAQADRAAPRGRRPRPPAGRGPAAARRPGRRAPAAGRVHQVGRGATATAPAATPPGADATSHLSAYLRLGMCTGPQIGRALGLPGALSAGREAFWRQICWREFSHHHLARHPEVLRVALRPDLRGVEWDDDPADLAAWEAGETGFPFVDAGMRQLAQTGWIHNRARMVVASFLVKDLLVDWRRGETVFMRALVDGDPANNNGGWQWVAGTGTDAAPYFRVLNPVLQSKRFDAGGRLHPPLRARAARRAGRPHPRALAHERRGAARGRVPHRERLPGPARRSQGAPRADARALPSRS